MSHPVFHHTQWKEGCPELTWGGSQGHTGSEEFGDPVATWWSSGLPQSNRCARQLLADLPLPRTTTQALRVLPHPAHCACCQP